MHFRNRKMWGYLFILPQVIGLIVFHIIPLIWAGYISFTDFDGFGRNNFIAFDNYYSLFKDDELWGSLRNTAYYALLTVGIGVTTALLVALALNVMKGKRFYRVFYFMPVITSTISMGVIWVWMLNGELGIINYVLSVIGIEGPSWLIDERWVIPSIALVGIWATLGKDMIIFLAGLQGISKSYYEASEIDGASGFKQFWHVTLPLLSPTTLFVTILALINSIQVFDQPYVMTGGGPGKSSYTLVYLIYNQAFVEFNMGRASAVAMILFAVILIITLIQFVASKRWVHYES
nr:sugar ABC transporter permease [Bacillus sp. FJAT-28004]